MQSTNGEMIHESDIKVLINDHYKFVLRELKRSETHTSWSLIHNLFLQSHCRVWNYKVENVPHEPCEVEPPHIELMGKCVWGQKAKNSAPIPADYSTWGSLEGLLLSLRAPPDVSVCVCVCGFSGSSGGQCAGSECWLGTFRVSETHRSINALNRDTNTCTQH